MAQNWHVWVEESAPRTEMGWGPGIWGQGLSTQVHSSLFLVKDETCFQKWCSVSGRNRERKKASYFDSGFFIKTDSWISHSCHPIWVPALFPESLVAALFHLPQAYQPVAQILAADVSCGSAPEKCSSFLFI